MIDRHGFRSNVGIVLVNDDARVLLARRVGGHGWQFPQGGIANGESPREAMYRELREEIGLSVDDVEEVGRTRRWLRYRLPPKYRQRTRKPVCIGQKQIWFLLKLATAEDAVRLDSSDSPEFEAWRWVDYWTPPEEVIYFKRRVYRRALEELAPLVFGDAERY